MSTNLADIIFQGYQKGLFPMAESRHDENLSLIEPQHRAIMPLKDFHISKSLKTRLNKNDYEITFNKAFPEVIAKCAEPSKGRDGTWINHTIERLFCQYHEQGLAHSVEFWIDKQLKGGIYGLQIGSIFCAESMFSRVPNASKVALTYLVARLWKAQFDLLDVQFVNPHLEQFGVYEIPQVEYLEQLATYKNNNLDIHLNGSALNNRELLNDYLKSKL